MDRSRWLVAKHVIRQPGADKARSSHASRTDSRSSSARDDEISDSRPRSRSGLGSRLIFTRGVLSEWGTLTVGKPRIHYQEGASVRYTSPSPCGRRNPEARAETPPSRTVRGISGSFVATVMSPRRMG